MDPNRATPGPNRSILKQNIITITLDENGVELSEEKLSEETQESHRHYSKSQVGFVMEGQKPTSTPKPAAVEAAKKTVRVSPAKRRREKPPKDTLLPRRGRKKKVVPLPPPSPKKEAGIKGRDWEYVDSDSGGEELDPDREKRKRLKRLVLQFLIKRVSPRQFLRWRKDLQAAQEHKQNYAEMKELIPDSIGMLERLFSGNKDTESGVTCNDNGDVLKNHGEYRRM